MRTWSALLRDRARFLAYARGACLHQQSPMWGARGPGHPSGQSSRSLATPRHACLAAQVQGNAWESVLRGACFLVCARGWDAGPVCCVALLPAARRAGALETGRDAPIRAVPGPARPFAVYLCSVHAASAPSAQRHAVPGRPGLGVRLDLRWSIQTRGALGRPWTVLVVVTCQHQVSQ